jgi:peptide/nickel transport system permease protein
MAATTAKPADIMPMRELSRLEQIIGPEWYRIYKGLIGNPLSVTGMGLILFFVLVALLAPYIAPPVSVRDPYLIPRDGFSSTPRGPLAEWKVRPPAQPIWGFLLPEGQWVHVMGTAGGQWDIFYGIVWGTRTALKVGLIIEGITLVVGILVGAFAAFYGGWLDEVLMRITDVFLSFPSLLAALTLSTVLTPILGKSIWPAMIALITFGWMGYARLIRGDILSVRERDFVTAARVVGANDGRILFRHIVPNAIYPTLVIASLNIGSDVLSFAALSFLGIGTEIGYADWGQLISFGRNWIPSLATYWWLVVWPGLALLLFVLGWNLVGDALRDVMDPRLRGRR